MRASKLNTWATRPTFSGPCKILSCVSIPWSQGRAFFPPSPIIFASKEILSIPFCCSPRCSNLFLSHLSVGFLQFVLHGVMFRRSCKARRSFSLAQLLLMVGITPTNFPTALRCVVFFGCWLVPCCFTCEPCLNQDPS